MRLKRLESWLPLLALLYALASRVFMLLRTDGRWADGDTGTLLVISQGIVRGDQVPAPRFLYGSDVGTPGLVWLHSTALGISGADYQLLLHPILGMLTPIAAFALARRLTGAATLQAAIVFMIAAAPEVLFETFRGSHGAFAHAFVLLFIVAMFPLVVRRDDSTAAWSVIAALLLAGVFFLNFKRSIIVVSLLFGALAACGSILVWNRSVRYWRPSLGVAASLLVAAAGFALVTVGSVLGSEGPLQRLADRVAGLVSAPPDATPAPAETLRSYASEAWPTPWHYAAVAIWNLVIPPLAILTLSLVVVAAARRRLPSDASIATIAGINLVLLGWMGIIAVGTYMGPVYAFSDILRIFAYASMGFAVLLVLLGRLVRLRFPKGRGARTLLIIAITWLAIAAPLKAGSDPLVNRNLRSFEASEAQALDWWADDGISSTLWAGPEPPTWDNRLLGAFRLQRPGAPVPEFVHTGAPPAFLSSSTVARHAASLGVDVPEVSAYNRVYDNGPAQFYVAAGTP